MDMVTYKLIDIFGSEIRSRSNIEKIRKDKSKDCLFRFDMDGIVFISRSVADELCDMEEKKEVKIENTCDMVNNMLSVVKKTRKEGRTNREAAPNVFKCESIEELADVFDNI